MLNFDDMPTINLPHGYRLREIDPAQDCESFFSYMNHPEVRRFVSSDNIPKNSLSAKYELGYWRDLFYKKYGYYWTIENPAGIMVGTAGYNAIHAHHLRADISYDLDPNYWGKGIMTNALQEVITFALDKLGVMRIQATVDCDNLRSVKLLEKYHFVREGKLAKYEFLDGVHRDLFMYALTR